MLWTYSSAPKPATCKPAQGRDHRSSVCVGLGLTEPQTLFFNSNKSCLTTPGQHSRGPGLQWGWDLGLRLEGNSQLQEFVAQHNSRWIGIWENKEMIETLLGHMIVSSLITPFVLWLSCSFGRICGKIKLLMRRVEEENEAMWYVSVSNSC